MKTLRNPFTGYKIKEGGKTHQKLLKQFGGHAGPFYQIKYTPEDGTLGRLCYYLDDNSKTQCSAWQTATDHPLYDYMDDPQPDIDLQLGGDILGFKVYENALDSNLLRNTYRRLLNPLCSKMK